MQGWKGCDQLQTNQTITLTDARDNNQYTVAKLLDSECWMTKNLRIHDFEATSDDSDVIEPFYIPKSSKLAMSSFNVDSVDIDDDVKYGGYYSWHAASASIDDISSFVGKANSSICPKGWHLPEKQEIRNLMNAYNKNKNGELVSSPVNLVLSGGMSFNHSFGCVGRNSVGGIWTSEILKAQNPDFFYFWNNGVLSGYGDEGFCGSYSGCSSCGLLPIRCIKN